MLERQCDGTSDHHVRIPLILLTPNPTIQCHHEEFQARKTTTMLRWGNFLGQY